MAPIDSGSDAAKSSDTGFEVPVLLIFWRRPQTVRMVIEAMRLVAPGRVFLACDGPNLSRAGEADLVAETRKTAESLIDWPCRIERLYSTNNQGCRRAVESALNWFFQNVAEGIVLEDDCVPHPDFFAFCSELLERYRDDGRVGCITGNNFQNGQIRGEGSYYFSKYPHCWGWASWRRAWSLYSSRLEFWPEWRKTKAWRQRFLNPQERVYWSELFRQSQQGLEDTWDYGWTAALNYHGCFTATPRVNLVQNVGFGRDSTHFCDGTTPRSIPPRPLGLIVHPAEVNLNEEADAYVFRAIFSPEKATAKSSALQIFPKIKKLFCPWKK